MSTGSSLSDITIIGFELFSTALALADVPTDRTTIVQTLPVSREQVSYIGIYAKNTRSEFTKIERLK